ncbi:MAG: restriction endonuclease subunit S [Patescibacteria group bacterium]|nr:restriction endonuclease subunit S [Patescibacteria group bacterium]
MRITTLNDLGKLDRGKSKFRPRNDESLYGGNYPFIQTSDIKNSILNVTHYSDTYNEKGLSQSKLWEPGILLITIAANIAETGILGIKACFPDSIVAFQAYKSKSTNLFVKYLFEILKLEFRNFSRGTTQDNLSLEKLKSFKFQVPDFPIQQKIAAILSVFDELIENNRRRIEILEEQAQLLYREWFVEFRFPGHEKVKMIYSELGKIPEGWKTDILKNVCTKINSGGTPRRDNNKYWA